MTPTLLKGVIPSTVNAITQRDLVNLDADMAAVTALVQAAVNVEMFTLPLYMCSMTSIQGTHAINSKGTSFFKGRVWPGMGTTSGATLTPNQQAYNTVFSVFIQEMLHLQLAANLATVLGVTPKFFNGTVLANAQSGWGCYGADNTVIPHIIDLKDTQTFSAVKVNLGALNKEQIDLFLAIEQSHDAARQDILPAALDKYFPAVPFAGWTAQGTEANLPLFGTIGWMYNSLLHYLAIEYTDGQNLWEKMFAGFESVKRQRDIFNAGSAVHHSKSTSHQPEYPRMPTQITEADTGKALLQAIDIIKGICDQGEGRGMDVYEMFRAHFKITLKLVEVTDNHVEPQFQPSKPALEADYPSYTTDGQPAPQSADADARDQGDKTDHWSRFDSLLKVISDKDFQTWTQWFAAGKTWTAGDLTTADYDPKTAPTNIPTPEQVAGALNELKSTSQQQLSLVVTGAIAGINSVLTQSWGNPTVAFPFPSMAGSGDRMSIFWAIFGQAPDLSQGTSAPNENLLYHACQGLDYSNPDAQCAAMAVYHTCAGSNSCKAQGGCGFVQPLQGGNSCGAQCGAHKAPEKGTCGAPTRQQYNTPNDNKCKSFGGCAVPISASQLYPTAGDMALVDIIGGDTSLGSMPFNVGDSVYDTAWQAYAKVMQKNGQTTPAAPPAPTALRMALPPST
ncbi:MAG: hypothetical protein FD135_3271 [Comamonadaceae bacterium]|nr:MAG: hypothetical protein FD135_3271 [Comamonadaceae bacterium]